MGKQKKLGVPESVNDKADFVPVAMSAGEIVDVTEQRRYLSDTLTINRDAALKFAWKFVTVMSATPYGARSEMEKLFGVPWDEVRQYNQEHPH